MPVFFDSKDEGPEEKYPQRVKLKDIFGKMVVSSLFLEVPDRNSPDIEFTNTDYGEIMLDRDKIVLSQGESPFAIPCSEAEQQKVFSAVGVKPNQTFRKYRGTMLGMGCIVEVLVED